MDQKATGGLKPNTIPDRAIPILSTNEPNRNTVSGTPTGGTTSGDYIEPRQIPNAEITTAPIAKEVVSFSFDTLMRRILGVFSVGQVGAITDLMGVTILDRYGLNSVNQFTTNTVAVTNQATSNASYIDVPGATITLTVKRTTRVMVLVNVTAHGTDCLLSLVADGVTQGDTIRIPANTNGSSASAMFMVSLSAGARILKLQFYSPTGGATTVDRASITYTALGK